MNIVAFPSRHGARNNALASIYKAQAVLREAGYHLAMDVGCSDEGDPWASFNFEGEADVIAHLAFIDDEFVADSPAFAGPLRSRVIGPLLEKLLGGLRRRGPGGLGAVSDPQMLLLVAAVALAASHVSDADAAGWLPLPVASAIRVAEELSSPKIAAALLAAAYPEEISPVASWVPEVDGPVESAGPHPAVPSGSSALAPPAEPSEEKPIVPELTVQKVELAFQIPDLIVTRDVELYRSQTHEVIGKEAPADDKPTVQVDLKAPAETSALSTLPTAVLQLSDMNNLIAALSTLKFTRIDSWLGNITVYELGYAGEQTFTFEDNSTLHIVGVAANALHHLP